MINMKKILLLALCFAMLIQSFTIVYANEASITLSMLVNYDKAVLNGTENVVVPTAPFVENDISFVPIKFIAEKFNFQVSGGDDSVNINGTIIQSGNDRIIRDGKTILALIKPVSVENTLFVSTGLIEQLLKLSVIKEDSGLIIISNQAKENIVIEKDILSKLGILSEKKPALVYETDFAKMRFKMIRDLYLPDGDPTDVLSKWQDDGSFVGIDYKDRSRAIWQPAKHLDNVLLLLRIVNTPTNKFYDERDIKVKVIKSLKYWLNNKFESDNWWYADIGVPMIMVDILICLPDGLSKTETNLLKNIAQKGSIRNEVPYAGSVERKYASSGGNLTDKLMISLKIAVSMEDGKAVEEYLDLLDNELRMFPPVGPDVHPRDEEGIKGDYSFHQHFNMLYFGGYGLGFMHGTNRILDYIDGTKFSISDRALNEYANFILNGLQWAFRGDYFDNTTIGRSIARVDAVKATGFKNLMKTASNYLIKLPGVERKGDLQRYLTGRASVDVQDLGNRYFWQSDYMVQKRPEFHYSVKTTSNRLRATESGNGESDLGYYLGDGVINLLQRGDEYLNIFPVWDWNKLPGTTTAQGGLKNIATLTDWMLLGQTPFVGGISDGRNGFNVFDYNRDGVAAKKSWFIFDNQVVSLGAGIKSSTSMNIYTSVNQCNLVGNVKVRSNAESKIIEKGRRIVEKTDWVLHDGVGYIFPKKDSVDLKNDLNKGSWATINTSLSKDVIEKDVFTLGINHGVKPNNGAYEYITLIGTDEEKLNEYVAATPIIVLENSEKIQAVWHKDLQIAQVAFYSKGAIALPNGTAVKVDKPCLLMLQVKEGDYQLSVSNPVNKKATVNVELSGNITNKVQFKLPDGQDAGRTIIYNSAIGFVKGDPNVKNMPEYSRVSKLLGITVDGNPLEDFNESIYDYKVNILDKQPQIKAFGNFKTTVTSNENMAQIEVQDPNDASNKSVYRIKFSVIK